MSKQIKKVTLDNLSSKVDKLTAAVGAGFKRMDKGFKDAKEDNESLARMVANGFENTAANAAKLGQGLEDVRLRLDNVAYRFEVKDLERRVKRLEDKTGIRHTIQR